MILLEDCPARRFLSDYGATLGKPSAILMISAHWETPQVSVATTNSPGTIHDFYGFPDSIHQFRYGAPGAPKIAQKAATCLRQAGVEVIDDPERGLDHGAWVPLAYMFPDADVPVAQISIQSHLGPRHHLNMGYELAALRDENVLILCSGNLTHGLRELNRGAVDAPPYPWVADFSQWIYDAIDEGRIDDVVNYRAIAPDAARNHPTEDHFLPLLIALGAGGKDARPERIHMSATYQTLSMDAYAFH
jgi:4,5-DOPA dioxygenase extradiol